MANTYTQLYVQVVFVVKSRQSLIREEWKQELYKYIGGIIKNNEHKLLAINGVGDHVHILIGMKPTQCLSDLMQDIKGNSSSGLTRKSSSMVNLNGKLGLVHSLIHILKFQK